jgi:1,2-dihydroxy-3-keto-5-methylthiopentene dioxygenase
MTLLQVMPADDPGAVLLRTEDVEKIGAELADAEVRFDRWPAAPGAEQDPLIAYREQVDALCQAGGYRLVDLATIAPDDADPQWPAKAQAARARFLEEHVHDEDEVRFFVSGRGCFYLHVSGRVLAVICGPGDMLAVPAGTRHWFDMGAQPCFTAIRFFQREDGWIADFTGSALARGFPSLEQLVAS